jgi:hypothetical protein
MIRLQGEGPGRAGSNAVEREHESDECRGWRGAGEAGDGGGPIVTKSWRKGTEESAVMWVEAQQHPQVGERSITQEEGGESWSIVPARCSST